MKKEQEKRNSFINQLKDKLLSRGFVQDIYGNLKREHLRIHFKSNVLNLQRLITFTNGEYASKTWQNSFSIYYKDLDDVAINRILFRVDAFAILK